MGTMATARRGGERDDETDHARRRRRRRRRSDARRRSDHEGRQGRGACRLPCAPCVRRVWCVAGAPCHAGRRARVSLRHVDVMGAGENVGQVRPAWWGVSIVGGGVSIWCARYGLSAGRIWCPGPFPYDGAGVMEWRGDVRIYERAGVIVTVGLDMCHRPML